MADPVQDGNASRHPPLDRSEIALVATVRKAWRAAARFRAGAGFASRNSPLGGTIPSTRRTRRAFDRFRAFLGDPLPIPEGIVQCPTEILPMSGADGLRVFRDGPVSDRVHRAGRRPPPPHLHPSMPVYVWAVCDDRVVYALEDCAFGSKIHKGFTKHSNLSAGRSAFSGGKMLIVDRRTLVINGRSGRFGPRTEENLRAVGQAFKASGYDVWLVGFNHPAKWPFAFFEVEPEWVD